MSADLRHRSRQLEAFSARGAKSVRPSAAPGLHFLTMATSRSSNKKKLGALPKNERRQQILSVAREAFAKRGYHQTTIDDIVALAGVARGTFYLYFEDKRAVFSNLVDRFAGQLSMAIVRIVTDEPSRSVVEQVRENIRAIIATCLSERAMTKILFTDAVGVDPA